MPDDTTEKAGRPGWSSLVLGVVAVIFLFVPIIGDVVTPPAGLTSIVLGFIGLGRIERGTAVNTKQTLTGIGLGAAAVLIWFVFFAVTL
ncbi:MAG TPA: hypothetical protein H9881_17020 [Candidatus Stackebrandtia excrementipullorum]|nr:hypothetical protein [Candidatus Stackebrandtia excrementipullorum]